MPVGHVVTKYVQHGASNSNYLIHSRTAGQQLVSAIKATHSTHLLPLAFLPWKFSG